MPAASALSVGPLNAFGSMIATAIPSALPEIAAFIALTISATSAVLDPVHWNCVPSSALASSAPYWVGVKNGFVVTWLTKTNRHFGVAGKLPAPPSSPVLSSLVLPHAVLASSAAPPPAIAARRRNRRRSMPGRSCISVRQGSSSPRTEAMLALT